MKHCIKGTLLATAVGVAMAGSAQAAQIDVHADIAVSTVWTANNTYNLQDQIYVLPGATLTIQAGVVVASDAGVGGSLAVTRGAQIIIQGTESDPVIMTSSNDVATWLPDAGHPTGGDPTTGFWREAANEWGNLTIMGEGYISEDGVPGNVPTCDANNFANMEGLTAAFPGDPNVRYGGGDDDDDSGSISYLSIRYGGKVVALANELNGLSLGGIGRGTDIDFVEIMNNVDDGIEIWGGAVNVSHFQIWNVGDDSFDCDQGWRGQAQYGLIVQGYSLDASQGSGVGDNGFETDGAENSHWQPVTTATIYNCTVIGQPDGGDGLTAWRDNARIQYRQCVFMDSGDEFVRFDNVDGDGAQGYGHMGTLTWQQTWQTADTVTSAINPCPNPAARYRAQFGGMLAEIKDSVFFGEGDYADAAAVGVVLEPSPGVFASNPACANVIADELPILCLVRDNPVVKGGLAMRQVIGLDPRAANDAVVADGSFTPAALGDTSGFGFLDTTTFRGAFDATDNWADGWSAAGAYGFYVDAAPASVTSLTSPSNAGTLTANGLPTIGNAGFGFTLHEPTGTCGVTVPSLTLLFTQFAPPAAGGVGFPFGQLGCGGGGSTLYALGPYFMTFVGPLWVGAPVVFSVAIPNSPSICGVSITTQAAFVASGNIQAGQGAVFTIGN